MYLKRKKLYKKQYSGQQNWILHQEVDKLDGIGLYVALNLHLPYTYTYFTLFEEKYPSQETVEQFYRIKFFSLRESDFTGTQEDRLLINFMLKVRIMFNLLDLNRFCILFLLGITTTTHFVWPRIQFNIVRTKSRGWYQANSIFTSYVLSFGGNWTWMGILSGYLLWFPPFMFEIYGGVVQVWTNN